MTDRQRILDTIAGRPTDRLVFMPRLDLWHPTALARGTMPARFQGMDSVQVALAEGWTPYRFMPDFLDLSGPEDLSHRGLGLLSTRDYLCRFSFGPEVEIHREDLGDTQRTTYRVAGGQVSTAVSLPLSQRRNGATYPLVTEHAVKDVGDYAVLIELYSHLRVEPDPGAFLALEDRLGESTLCFAAACMACSPMHAILRDLVDPTQFYLHYHDHPDHLRRLEAALEPVFQRVLDLVCASPVRAVVWGANYDDTLTYPRFFAREMLPWLQKATAALHEAGKVVGSHTDGENQGLMDYLAASGLDVADSVCPKPMTSLDIGEYYRRWGGKLTIFGGIPQDFLLPGLTSRAQLDDYLDSFFSQVAPGDHLVVSIADAVPPDADWDRLRYIGDEVRRRGALPLGRPRRAARAGAGVENAALLGGLEGLLRSHAPALAGFFGDLALLMESHASEESPPPEPPAPPEPAAEPELPAAELSPLEILQQDILNGDDVTTLEHLRTYLAQGLEAQDLLQDGMLSAMEVIGRRFRDGTVFIPEVLLSARALNLGVELLEPHLAKGQSQSAGTVMIGTVQGDLHDIGKNIVLTMLRGVGFKVIDLGINVACETFVARVEAERPDILGLSALLTTTMPELGKVIEAITEAGLRDQVKIMVGGAPVSADYAAKIGADAYAEDAGEAVDVARRLLGDA